MELKCEPNKNQISSPLGVQIKANQDRGNFHGVKIILKFHQKFAKINICIPKLEGVKMMTGRFGL